MSEPHTRPARAPLRALFVTYAMLGAPGIGPSMIGALKRCLRLIHHLPPGEVEPLWVHSGPLFRHDPLVREMLPRLPRYGLGGRLADGGLPRFPSLPPLPETPALNLPRAILTQGLPQLYQTRALRRLFSRLSPQVVVLGDNPLGGLLRRASEAARELRLPQVGVDDYLSLRQHEALTRSSPQVDGWFLVGLPFDGRLGRLTSRLAVAPPLLPGGAARGAGEPENRVDVTILGYDPKIARLGLELLARLPPGTSGRLITGELTAAERADRAALAGGARLRFLSLPGEGELRDCLRDSGLVFCKSGFQQIAEALAVGTPVITSDVKGGVPEVFMDEALRPYVHYLPASPAAWGETLALARQWIAARPSLPWAATLDRLASPARYGGELFAAFLRETVEGGAWNPAS